MKKIIAFMMLIFISTSFTSCEKDETASPSEKIIEGEFKIDLTASKLGEPFSLMTYSSTKELQDKIPDAISGIYDDVQEEMAANGHLSDAFINIKFSKGKAYISEIVFFDSANEEIISGSTLNYDTMQYEPISGGLASFWGSLVGNCPEGYSSLGSCSNFGGTKECVTNKVATFLSNSISGIGDCANVQVSVGKLATTVCGKEC